MKILVLGPVLPQWSDMQPIAKSLSFLDLHHQVTYLDSLQNYIEGPRERFYTHWHTQLNEYLDEFDAFLGFSFGGVILQQCFDLFNTRPRKIILFSTPSFSDPAILEKLGSVIKATQKNQLDAAISLLNNHVFFPYDAPKETYIPDDRKDAARRLIYGLSYVLETDAREKLASSNVNHLHFIGDSSALVNQYNVIPPTVGKLIVVPKAGMRLLQDNLPFCEPLILKELHDEHNIAI